MVDFKFYFPDGWIAESPSRDYLHLFLGAPTFECDRLETYESWEDEELGISLESFGSTIKTFISVMNITFRKEHNYSKQVHLVDQMFGKLYIDKSTVKHRLCGVTFVFASINNQGDLPPS